MVNSERFWASKCVLVHEFTIARFLGNFPQ